MAALGWLFLVLLLVGAGVVIGLFVAAWLDDEAHRDLERREAQVRTDMDALTRTQQLNTAYLTARRAMWDGATRHRAPGRSGPVERRPSR